MFNINKSKAETWASMGPRAMFGQFMLDLANRVDNLMVLSGDLGRSSGLDRFKKKFPDKYLSVGICEQNLVGVASGLSREGYKVFITSFAPFLSMRASEQIRMNLGYMKHNVNIIALGSGVSMAYLGNSHFGLEDINYIRSIPGINISCPADSAEMGKMLYDYALNERGPSYIRLTGVPGIKNVYQKNYNYRFGKAVNIFKGKEILILSHGSIVSNCVQAVQDLKKDNVNCSLININTLNPLDQSIFKKIDSHKYVIVIEEHSSIGGLYTIISEYLVKRGIKKKIFSLNLGKKFGPTGTYNYLLEHHGLSAKKIKKFINKVTR